MEGFIEKQKKTGHVSTATTDDILVVGELNFRYIQSFATVQLLFVFQNVVVEEFLQLFVTIIDAELLERIDRKIFCKKLTNQLPYPCVTNRDKPR